MKRMSDTLNKYSKKVFGSTFTKGEYSFFAYFKGGVALIFVLGTFGIFFSDDFTSIKPLHASGEQETVVDKGADLEDSQELLSARLLSEEYDVDYTATGGAYYETIGTVNGDAFLAQNALEPVNPYGDNRTEIVHYTVKPNDTINAIAQRFNLRAETILWSNQISNANYINPGDKLIILPVDGVNYDVKTGDTLGSIASAHKADIDDIVEFNGLQSADYVFAGQQLIIPGGTKPKTTVVRTTTAAVGTYIRDMGGYFTHPTNWVGNKTQGLHPTNAIDWGATCGTPIYAAASGTVIGAVNWSYNRWVGGFGNYVLINHPNGTRTRYAHIRPSGVAVSAGQWVNQGQIIGYVGTTGRSTGCHVHFEVHGARNPF